jgi:hypothetical protein
MKRVRRSLVLAVVISGAALAMSAAPSSEGGVTADQLANAG